MKKNLFPIISCLIISSCNSSSTKNNESQTKHDYPAYIIKSFMDGCAEDNPHPDISQTMICSCLIEKIQSKYTLQEYNEISKSQEGKEFEEYQLFLNKSAAECIKNNSIQTK